MKNRTKFGVVFVVVGGATNPDRGSTLFDCDLSHKYDIFYFG